jgi:hypothetical protein
MQRFLKLSLLTSCLACSLLLSGSTSAATSTEALQWLEGRWGHDGGCSGKWIEFQRRGSNWFYREIQYRRGQQYPATVSVNPSGVVTVQTTSEDGVFEYVVTFQGKDLFRSVEGTVAPQRRPRMNFTYARCV